jgi:hypothetical protein
MNKLNQLLCAVALASVGSAANADQITLTTDYGTTSSFGALGATNLPVTSVYYNDGTIVKDSEATDLVGKTLAFSDVGGGLVGQLSPLTGSNPTNAFFGNDWQLMFTYTLEGYGTFVDGLIGGLADGAMDGGVLGGGGVEDGLIDALDGIVPTYTSGLFEFFYQDTTGAQADLKVLELNLESATPDGANVVMTALANFDWYDENDAGTWTAGQHSLVQNFFTDVQSGESFYDNSQKVVPPRITFRNDFNVDPNYLPKCVDVTCDTLTRTTDTNLSATFSVPEPTSLAILGLGLFGLALRARKQS